MNFKISCQFVTSFEQNKKTKKIMIKVYKFGNLMVVGGNFFITWVEFFDKGLVIWFEIVLEHVGNGLDFD